MRYKQPGDGKKTTVQSVITVDTDKKLKRVAKQRKLSVSAFIAVAIESKLNEVDAA